MNLKKKKRERWIKTNYLINLYGAKSLDWRTMNCVNINEQSLLYNNVVIEAYCFECCIDSRSINCLCKQFTHSQHLYWKRQQINYLLAISERTVRCVCVYKMKRFRPPQPAEHTCQRVRNDRACIYCVQPEVVLWSDFSGGSCAPWGSN